MNVIKSKEFSVRRQSIIELDSNTDKLIALVAEPGYIVRRDSTRNKAFPDAVGYVVVHADPIRHADEGALYYVDFLPKQGQLIFCQGNTRIHFRAVFRTKE